MTHQIKLSDGTEIELTDAQAKFAFCWVNREGKLLCDPAEAKAGQASHVRDHIEKHGDSAALHHDD